MTMRIDTIKRDIDRKMNRAMQKTKTEGDTYVEQSFDAYYGGGSPIRYVRTGQIRNAAFPGVIEGGNLSYNMRIGYVPSKAGQYGTGMRPSGGEVFEWMVNGSMGVVGWGGFANLALAMIEQAAEINFASAFG